METVSISKAAELIGVNKSTISRQVRAGIIPNRAEPGEPPRVNLAEARRARADFLDPSKRNRPGGADDELQAPAADAEAVDDAGGEENTTSERRSPAGDLTADPAYRVHRTEKERLQAELARMQLDEKQGKLISRSEVETSIAIVARELRDGLLQSGMKLAGELVGKTDPAEIARIIEAEHRALCERMASALGKASE